MTATTGAGMSGMDIDAVDALALRLEGAARQLSTIVQHVDLMVGHAGWVGADADDFCTSEWPRHRRALDAVSVQLGESSRAARANADQQRVASEARGGSVVSTATGTPAIPIEVPGPWKWNRDGSPLYRRGRTDTDAIDPDDVEQGALGDCFLLASLKALAQSNPDVIRNMIHDNGDGTFTVTFHQDGMAQPITVNNEFPTLVQQWWFDDRTPFAKHGDHELWVRLVEKAYVQQYHGGYTDIDNGFLSDAAERLTGVAPTSVYPGWTSDADLDSIGARLAAKEIAVTTGTPPSAAAGGLTDLYRQHSITEHHAYSVERIDPVLRLVYLDNPYAGHDLVLSYDDYRLAFNQLHYVTV